jgi:hypothetical protein
MGRSAPLTYTLITQGDNQPGSHNLTGGCAKYMLELTDPVTVRARVYPNFTYDTASDQPIWSWYNDANNYLTLLYDAGNDRYEVHWKDGGTERTLDGDVYTDNSHQAWTDIDVVIDFTNSEGALYLNRVSKDTLWSDSPDAKGMNYPLFEIRGQARVEGDYKINHVRVFLSLESTAAQIANDYKDVEDEEIIWHFNGEGCGRTRCNVTRFVQNIYNEKSVENPASGAAGANTCTVVLNSENGEFADDQYDTFDPTAEKFNGESTQKYMQNRCRLEVETWYNHDYELVFNGRLDENSFSRNSAVGQLQTVTISAEDTVSDIARKFRRKAKTWEDKKLSDLNSYNSLIHLITRLATADPIYNFISNASFENATISNSWTVNGSGATFSRVGGGLFGDYQGDLVYGSEPCFINQTITFLGNKKLNVGETYTFSIWLKSADACAGTYGLDITEADSVGDNANSTSAYNINGGEGWQLFQVSHTVTDSDSDRFKIYLNLDDSVTLSVDGAMLIQNNRAFNWFIGNNHDGISAVENADDADSDSYDIVGFDVDHVNITHPWALIPQDGNVWEQLQLLGDAVGAMYLGVDEAGTFKLRAKLKDGYTDPTSLETITDGQITDVATSLEMEQANKIIVHGVKIKKYTNVVTLWNAQAAGIFNQGSGEIIAEVVVDNAYWPDSIVDAETNETRGETWAKYGQV